MMMENLRTLIPRVRSVRSYGSAGLDLAYLAMGAVDLFFDSGLHIWDYAGPSLIVREVCMDDTKWTLNTELSPGGRGHLGYPGGTAGPASQENDRCRLQ